MPNDFRLKCLNGVGRDWLLTYDELEPFYYEAELRTGISGAPNTGSPRTKPFPMEACVSATSAQLRYAACVRPGKCELVTAELV